MPAQAAETAPMIDGGEALLVPKTVPAADRFSHRGMVQIAMESKSH